MPPCPVPNGCIWVACDDDAKVCPVAARVFGLIRRKVGAPERPERRMTVQELTKWVLFL